MKSFGIASLFFLGFALLETAILSNIIFLPAVPDFLLITSLYLSLQNGRLFGVSAGFMSGLILDFLGSVPFGLNCLFRTVFGYVAGLFNKSLNINGVFFPILLGSLATIFKAFLLWVISIFYPNLNLIYTVFSFSFLFELLLNAILSPLVFRFLDIFKNSLTLNLEKVC